MLLNLLGNAIQHTSDDFVALRVTAFANSTVQPGATSVWQFEVEDGGSGMATDLVQELNTEWSHPSRDLCLSQRKGMGLKISKRLVRAMGGRMFVTSRLGLGTLVTFQIMA